MHTVGCTFVRIVEIRCARMKRAGLVCILPKKVEKNNAPPNAHSSTPFFRKKQYVSLNNF
jgi:hypothetical protein